MGKEDKSRRNRRGSDTKCEQQVVGIEEKHRNQKETARIRGKTR
jgi:hypothetical protein